MTDYLDRSRRALEEGNMRIVMHRVLGLLTIWVTLAPLAWNQTDPNPDRLISPDRGVSLGRAYQVSDIERVNMSNGGLSLRIPLAQLPAGPAGAAGVSLVYSSKYWEDLPAAFALGGSKSVTHVLQGAPAGGWRLRYDYELRVVFPETRSAYTDVCAPGPAGLVQLRLMEPDGSEHQLYSLDVPAESIPQYREAGTYRRGGGG